MCREVACPEWAVRFPYVGDCSIFVVYGLIRALELFCGLLRATAAEPAFFRREEPYVPCIIPQMAPGRL